MGVRSARSKMQAQNHGLIASGRVDQTDNFHDLALGVVSTRSFPAIVGTADMMLKTAEVTLVGYEKIGSGYCSAIVRGRTANVRLAVKTGAEKAKSIGQLVSSLVIPRPPANLEAVLPIGNRLHQLTQRDGNNRLANQAIGLLETRGFPAMVGAADAMLKSAEVQLASYETIGDGLCTVIIRGTVSNVAMAIDVGVNAAEKIGELHAVAVITRPLDDLEQTLPLASCWIEQPQPLQLPIKIEEKQTETEPVQLPDLSSLPVPIEEEIE